MKGKLHKTRAYITNITNTNTWPTVWKWRHFLLARNIRHVWPHSICAKLC